MVEVVVGAPLLQRPKESQNPKDNTINGPNKPIVPIDNINGRKNKEANG